MGLSTKNLPNRQRDTSPRDRSSPKSIHSRMNSKNIPKESKMIWNLRKPEQVREAKQTAQRKRKEDLDDDILNYPASSRVPRRAVVNDLLRLSDSDDDGQGIKKIVRGKVKKPSSSVHKSKSSIKKT